MEKKKKLQILINQQQLAIAELSKSMEDYRAYSDLDETETRSPQDFSQQTVAKESQLRLEQQLDRAENDLSLLERYANESYDTVQAGALFQAGEQWFLAGISLGGYDSGKFDILCISTGAPAFEAILGKKVGEHFKLGDNEYQIKSIS